MNGATLTRATTASALFGWVLLAMMAFAVSVFLGLLATTANPILVGLGAGLLLGAPLLSQPVWIQWLIKPHSDLDVDMAGSDPLTLADEHAMENQFKDKPTIYKIDWLDLSQVSPRLRSCAMPWRNQHDSISPQPAVSIPTSSALNCVGNHAGSSRHDEAYQIACYPERVCDRHSPTAGSRTMLSGLKYRTSASVWGTPTMRARHWKYTNYYYASEVNSARH